MSDDTPPQEIVEVDETLYCDSGLTVRRFNGWIEDAPQSHRFHSYEERADHLALRHTL